MNNNVYGHTGVSSEYDGCITGNEYGLYVGEPTGELQIGTCPDLMVTASNREAEPDPLTEKLNTRYASSGRAWISFPPSCDIIICSGEEEVLRLTPADQARLLGIVEELLGKNGAETDAQ